MTARLVFEGVLIELSKIKAPSLTLDEFNYLFNKAVNLYINKLYNIYDLNQLTSDNCRVLKATAQLTPKLSSIYLDFTNQTEIGQTHNYIAAVQGPVYEFNLPTDYLHLLNCVCIFNVKELYKCWDAGTYASFGATRLTADAWSTIINDFYNRPLPTRPYYYLHHVNISNEIPTNPKTATTGTDNFGYNVDTTDFTEYAQTISDLVARQVLKVNDEGYIVGYDDPQTYFVVYKSEETNKFTYAKGSELTKIKYSPTGTYELIYIIDKSGLITGTLKSNLSRTLSLGSKLLENSLTTDDTRTTQVIGSMVEKVAGVRYGNASEVRCEIRCGRDNSVFELVAILIDYLKAPQYIRLTQELIDLTKDTSLMMEFPDYVCQEIINELVHIVMENTGDPRLLTHAAISTSIASSAQQSSAASSAE